MSTVQPGPPMSDEGLRWELYPNGVTFDIRGTRYRGAIYAGRTAIADFSGDDEDLAALKAALAATEARGYRKAIEALTTGAAERVMDQAHDVTCGGARWHQCTDPRPDEVYLPRADPLPRIGGIMTDPNADLADIRTKWLAFCSHDLGLPYPCICPNEDHRPVIAALVTEVETLRAEVARLEGDVREVGHERDLWQAEHATARDVIAAVKIQRDEHRADLAALHAEAARLRAALDLAERDKAHALVEQLRLTTERDEALRMLAKEQRDQSNRWGPVLAERDAMRPVVEAAKACVIQIKARGIAANNQWLRDETRALIAAVDQMAPSRPHLPPQSDERGEEVAESGSEASGGSEGDRDWRWATPLELVTAQLRRTDTAIAVKTGFACPEPDCGLRYRHQHNEVWWPPEGQPWPPEGQPWPPRPAVEAQEGTQPAPTETEKRGDARLRWMDEIDATDRIGEVGRDV